MSGAVGEARRRLVEAHAKRAEAALGLDSASTAVASARALVDEVRREVEGFVEVDKAISNNRSAGLARAIRAGLQPSFDDPTPLSEAASRRIEAEARLAAATQALAELESDERTAVTAFAAEQGKVREAAEALLLAEASFIAEENSRSRRAVIDPENAIGRRQLQPHCDARAGSDAVAGECFADD